MTTAVHLQNLSVHYRDQIALQHVTGTFQRGSLTAVFGPNGAGKSTLLAAMIGRQTVSGGGIEFAPGLRERTALLPQRSELDRSFPIRVLDVVLLGHWHRAGAFGRLGATELRTAMQALERVRLPECASCLIGELSVGQLQRVLFARLLVQDAQLLLLDEPFAAVDEPTTSLLLELIQQWHGESRTVIAVLHDIEQIRAHFPCSLLLAREQVAWSTTEAAFSPTNLARLRAFVPGGNGHSAQPSMPGPP